MAAVSEACASDGIRAGQRGMAGPAIGERKV
jgi:hypothetical protein